MAASFSPDSRFIVSGSYDEGYNPVLVIWDVSTGRPVRSFSGLGNIFIAEFNPDGKSVLSNSKDGALKLYDAASGKMIREYMGSPDITSAKFSKDGKYIAAGYYTEKIITLWDTLSSKSIRTFKGHSDSITSLDFSPDGKYIISASRDKTIKLWDVASGKEVNTFTGHTGNVESVAFSHDGKYIISGSDDSTIRIWNIKTGEWVAFINHSNGQDWLIFDNDGYWDSSRYGGDLVAMVEGMDCWNIDQFAVKNNRPDLILAKLPNPDQYLISEYYRQYQKRIKKLNKLYGIKDTKLSSDMHVPRADILKSDQHGKTLNLSIKFYDSQYDIVSYNVYVNDVPVYKEIGKKIDRKKELVVSEILELSTGDNKIEVSCFNDKGVESYRTALLAVYEGTKKGSLYFAGFGVADYSDISINDLRYSENDVLDLAKKFSLMKNGYDKIYVKTYTGRNVTPANIKAAKEFVKSAGVDDTVILFISGHGMHDNDEYKTFYYLTQNADMNNLKSTAADFETIEDILAGINPRKKLFLMDTCDSGELDDFAVKKQSAVDEKNIKGIPRTPKGMVVEYTDHRGYFDRGRYIYNDLFRRTGAVVFSSSKGGEASWEFDYLKNGAFTEAILEALSGKADTDGNGSVAIDELQKYVNESVNKYTEGKQHPVIDRDNIYMKLELPVK